MSATTPTPPDTTPTDAALTDTALTAAISEGGRRPGRNATGSGRASAAEVAAASHAATRPPVWWPARGVRRERADAIDAYRAELALRARHARIAAIRCGRHLGRVPYGYTLDGGRLVIDPVPAGAVAALYRWRVGSAGWVMGVAEIVRLLAADPDHLPHPLADGPGKVGVGGAGRG